MTAISNPLGAFGQPAGAAQGTQGVVVTFRAGGTINAGQIVALSSVTNDNPTVTVASAATDVAVGVAVEPAVAGAPVQVCVHGACKVRASSTSIAAGTRFSTNGSGQVAAASTTLGQFIVGVALEATGTTPNDLKWAWINPQIAYAS